LGATLQIGEPSFLAQRFGVPVVSDFRAADVAAGGQGAPLIPYADWCLLTHSTKSRAIQNIGGIGNVTYLPANAAPDEVIGFDTGPGNMLIDRAAQWATDGKRPFDEDGRLAEQGLKWSRSEYGRDQVLESLLSHPFLQRTPPKSAGREEFGELYWQEIQGGQPLPGIPTLAVSVLTEFTAASIAEAYRRFLPAMPDEVIVGGGGARNPTLMRFLAERLAPIPVRIHEDLGINSDSKEAVAFALLGNETMLGNPSNLPSVTGARRRTVLGKITLP
jgi:anhydro-N-acetylmuramic acid kinase